MEYITIRQAAEKWNRSQRWVQTLCRNGRIEGAYRPARDWLIPADAECPKDKRRRAERCPAPEAGKNGAMKEFSHGG